jgi:hypothetical protein
MARARVSSYYYHRQFFSGRFACSRPGEYVFAGECVCARAVLRCFSAVSRAQRDKLAARCNLQAYHTERIWVAPPLKCCALELPELREQHTHTIRESFVFRASAKIAPLNNDNLPLGSAARLRHAVYIVYIMWVLCAAAMHFCDLVTRPRATCVRDWNSDDNWLRCEMQG